MKRILIIIAVVTLGGLTAYGPGSVAQPPTNGPEQMQRESEVRLGVGGTTDVEDGDPDVMKNQRKHMNMDGATASDEWELEIDEDGDKEIQYLQWGPWGEPWGPRPWD